MIIKCHLVGVSVSLWAEKGMGLWCWSKHLNLSKGSYEWPIYRFYVIAGPRDRLCCCAVGYLVWKLNAGNFATVQLWSPCCRLVTVASSQTEVFAGSIAVMDKVSWDKGGCRAGCFGVWSQYCCPTFSSAGMANGYEIQFGWSHCLRGWEGHGLGRGGVAEVLQMQGLMVPPLQISSHCWTKR